MSNPLSPLVSDQTYEDSTVLLEEGAKHAGEITKLFRSETGSVALSRLLAAASTKEPALLFLANSPTFMDLLGAIGATVIAKQELDARAAVVLEQALPDGI